MTKALRTKLTQAIERRFGKSTMPYTFGPARCMNNPHPGMLRITDTETGSWVEGWITEPSHRFVVLAEHDAMATDEDTYNVPGLALHGKVW